MTHKSSSLKKQLSWQNANVLASSWKDTSSFAEWTKLDMLSILDDLALLSRNINLINNQNVWCVITEALEQLYYSIWIYRMSCPFSIKYVCSNFPFGKKVFSLATDFFFGQPPSLLAFTTFFLKSHVPKDDQKGFSPLAWDAVCNI